jgi:hypothetical protein
VIVIMDQQMSGPRYDGRDWPGHGVEFEVPDWEGVELCAGGIAHPKAVVAEERKVEVAMPPPDPAVEVRAEPPAAQAVPPPAAVEQSEENLPVEMRKRGPGRPPGSTNKPK